MSRELSAPEIRMVEEIQKFLQSAVHDLRAHARRIGTAAQLLAEMDSNHDREQFVRQVLDGVTKTDQLLAAIGRYSLSLNPATYSMSRFSSASAVRFAIANLDREIKQTHASIDLGEMPQLWADRDRLSEVFEHLLSNSLKFRSSKPPEVEIQAGLEPEGWAFSVTDNGEGIPAKYHDRLFRPFSRLHGPEIEGSGLGLATSRKIIEAHGGRIWIEAKEGAGATLKFVLPVGGGN
jgi:light-regulated signal transduction histidine kinase (bacteriophytochrome)